MNFLMFGILISMFLCLLGIIYHFIIFSSLVNFSYIINNFYQANFFTLYLGLSLLLFFFLEAYLNHCHHHYYNHHLYLQIYLTILVLIIVHLSLNPRLHLSFQRFSFTSFSDSFLLFSFVKSLIFITFIILNFH
jgi:hypothetical protein